MLTCYFINAVAASSVGSGFQHGYNTGVLNAPEEVLLSWINGTYKNISPKYITLIWSVTVSIFAIGGIVGGLLIELFAVHLGRKRAMIANNFIAIWAGLLMGISKYSYLVYILILGRFFIGINAGLNSGLCPMYLTEISPLRYRGATGAMYQLLITITILLSQVLGTANILGNDERWPFLLGLIIIPAIYQTICFLFFLPESPKYSLMKGNEALANKVLQKLFGANANEALSNVQKEIQESSSIQKVTICEMVKSPKLRKPLLIINVLMIAQQFSGINAVILYSTGIFKAANLSLTYAQYATIGVGVVNVIATLVSVALVDLVGRKVLLLVGFGGMTLTTIGFMVCLLLGEGYILIAGIAIALIYIYIILFAIGAGPIPWIIGSELFNTTARPLALSIAVPVNWAFNFLVGLGFLPLKDMLGPWVFIIFISCNALAFIFVWIFVPETKNKPIEEIIAAF